MSAIFRILEAAAVLKPVAQGVALRMALPKIIKLAALGVATCVIAGAVILFAFYALHVELMVHGFDIEQALLITFCVACMVLVFFALWLLQAIEAFKHALLPKPTGVMGIVDSFVEGIKASVVTTKSGK